MPRKPRTPPFSLTAPEPVPEGLPGLAPEQGVRLVLEGADHVAVEAAAAALRACLGPRFAVTGRRLVERGSMLRITGGIRIDPAAALDMVAGATPAAPSPGS
ncbi:hypothetical protein [Falsiroseomonas sp.]|uniref:hypothetical protein n=1 Tax=Falsiroseomonas sp. TaxID=2870721 RepID=UPI003F719780